MNRKIKRFLILFIVFITGLCGMSDAFEGRDPGSIVIVEDNTLTVNLNSVALEAVLEKISRQSGIRYQGDKQILSEKITISLNKVPVEAGLKRLLNKYSYIMKYNSTGSPVSLIIYGKNEMKSYDQPDLRPPVARSADVQRDTATNDQASETEAEEKTPQLQKANLEQVKTMKISKDALLRDPMEKMMIREMDSE